MPHARVEVSQINLCGDAPHVNVRDIDPLGMSLSFTDQYPAFLVRYKGGSGFEILVFKNEECANEFFRNTEHYEPVGRITGEGLDGV
jgi:hypothetical protein